MGSKQSWVFCACWLPSRKVAALHSAEMLVKLYRTAWHHIPDDATLQEVMNLCYVCVSSISSVGLIKNAERYEIDSVLLPVYGVYGSYGC
jgi:hypothetical protein